MITRQRIVTFGVPAAATATIITAALLTARDRPAPDSSDPRPTTTIPTYATSSEHAIDVVFAVDTTGSMGGLLDGAKRTVWSIASHIRKTDPNADLRIGLVAYRDLGDDYVTRPFSLTHDLDAVYSELYTYEAAGGGDTPENVDAALDTALHGMAWRPGAKKLVFVVGDAPPASRGDVPTYDVLAREAASKGITINTIRCGWDADTQVAFQKIAALAGGEFSSIQQDGGVQQVATPYDDRIADLSSRYDRTSIIVGGAAERGRYARKMAAAEAAPAPAKADRAAYYAKGKASSRAADDLVGSYATGGDASLETVDPGALPDELRGRDKAELKAELDKRVAERDRLQREIAELAKQREEYLAKHAKDGEGGFDEKVKQTVERQMKK
jgi:hypothetical protein